MINGNSSWGGSPTVYAEGKGRTILDLTAYGPQEYRFAEDGGTTGYFNSTSSAAPTVAAAAVDLIDMFKQSIFSSQIDDPGTLFVNMLMQGDRQGHAMGQGLLTEGFDPRYGAGRMRLRMVNNEGMDAPWWYVTTSVCIDDQQVVEMGPGPWGGLPAPAGTDAFKAVIWWYDRRHEDGTQVDQIDLVLRKTNGTVVATSASGDNKQMVYYAQPDQIGSIEIIGQSVTADGEGCGTDSMKVYVAYAYEDSARDDGDGPSWDSQACQGVEPW